MQRNDFVAKNSVTHSSFDLLTSNITTLLPVSGVRIVECSAKADSGKKNYEEERLFFLFKSSCAIPRIQIETLINDDDDDGDGNENGKKKGTSFKTTLNSARALHFFVHFFAVTARLRREAS